MSIKRIGCRALVLALLVSYLFSTASACTIFSASNGDAVLVGNNEDWNHNNFSLVFYSADRQGFGHVAFVATENYWDIRAGMNEHGVFIDSTWVPSSNVTIDPEKPFLYRNFFKEVLRTCSSVNDTIEFMSTYNIADTWDWQVLVADSFGESVVIVAGPDGTVWYIRGNETYQLITNGNIACPELGQSSSSALRFYNAKQKLQEIGDNLTIENARDVLDAAHSDYTAFSSVYDLVNRNVYIYFNHDYTKEVVFNLDDELLRGGHAYEIYELFLEATALGITTSTATIPSTTTTTEELTDLSPIQIIVIGLSFALVISCIALVVAALRRKNT
jgi:penicillin V acylase-like amidase (Ntn superfamily)